MPRPIAARIHLDALEHNLRRARSAAPDARVWAVVKANAYGHGIERVYPALRAADGFALLDIEEAERVRALGWRGPILLLEGCFGPRDLEACARLDLWHTVHHAAQVDMLAAHKTNRPGHVFLKMNSGMNRLGFRPAAFRQAWQRLSGLTQVESITLMTHWADADAVVGAAMTQPVDAVAADAAEPGRRNRQGDAAIDPRAAGPATGSESPRGIAKQLSVFQEATSDLPGERSLCNSAATLRHGLEPNVRGDWIRAGIMLYGSSPDAGSHDAAHWDLKPAMTLRAELIATQDLDAGEHVGYGSTYTAAAPMRLGVVACGYADGYPRVAPTGTPVLVDGIRTTTIGRVSMDMITVDLTPVPEAGVGSEVTLWGLAGSGAVLPIDEVAGAAGTVGYELMCALAARVPTTAR